MLLPHAHASCKHAACTAQRTNTSTLFPFAQCACCPLLAPLFAPLLLRQVREAQESMALLDRTHTLKVQQIQREYQDYMERIRNKAQVRRVWAGLFCCLFGLLPVWPAVEQCVLHAAL